MKSLTDTYQLPGGVQIPCIGFGTWQISNGETAIKAVSDALACGYRHIDTAAMYGNEQSVGIAVKQSGIPRNQIFITSKLQNNMHGYDDTMTAFAQTMRNLGMDYLDLYLIHWPNPIKYRDQWHKANAGSWKAFEQLHKEGRIRAIGVSNFHPHHFEALLDTASVIPMVNQIRLCPGDTQDEVAAYCKERSILLEAYSPFGVGQVFSVPQLKQIAAQYGKSVAQVCIRWSLQRGYLPLPKSMSIERMRENADVFDFTLSPKDVDLITNLKGCCGFSTNPDTITW